MQLSHTAHTTSAEFDEPNLIVSSGLLTAVALAETVGVADLAADRVTVPGSAGANAGVKLMCLVAGMVAGADSIQDMGVLRHGAMGKVFTGLRAPSTLGTHLRGFQFGHVRQLDAVASRTLIGLAGRTPILGGIEDRCFLDIDDTIDRVFGVKKQGAQFGYTKVRGLNAQLAVLSTPETAPVIAATRLRRGARHSSHGAERMITDALATARRCGATAAVLVRADSAYCTASIVAAIVKADALFSLTIATNPAVRTAVEAIADDAWTRIDYPWAVPDPDTGELVTQAEVAEVTYTAFTSRPKKHRVTARLIVRRIPERNKNKLQDALFPMFRYHCVFTNNPDPLVEAEVTHRAHAVIEQVIADLKASALAHLPSGKFNANAAWLVAAAIAFNLTRAVGVLAGGKLRKAETATIRARLINVPARVASSARRIMLHLPRDWIWAEHWLNAWRSCTVSA